MRRVVITGIGAISPIGNSAHEYWQGLMEGKSGAAPITRFDAGPFKTQFACEVKGYDPLNYFDKKEVRKLDLFSQYGLVAANEAIADSGIDFRQMEAHRAGVIFASGIGGFETFEEGTAEYYTGNGDPRFSPFFITKIIANGLAGQISINHGLKGVNYCPTTACASSTQSLIQAYNYIKWGKVDVVVAGGSEAPITPASIGGFNSMKALSTNNDEHHSACRPFDASRDGFVIGEGAGAMVVESLERAQSRGARIYAEIVGGGETADAYHITGTHPEGEGAYWGMKLALEEAGLEPQSIDYINAHATSTGVGDLSELKAIEKLFDGHLSQLAISATKSMTGHLLGGTGAIEAIATSLALYHGQVPPTVNTKVLDEAVPKGMDLCLGKKQSRSLQYALSNSFGFGGHCAAVVLKKME